MTLSTTVNMWLGIAFVVLAIAAVLLQGWLWSYPMDPPDDPRGRSTAPRSWTNVHRLVGAAYVLIYVVLMIQMVPRLWHYQVELPARTVIHACMGITIGCLLLAKFTIIRFMQWFGKALPAIGLGLLICTIILATLSVPFAVRAHGFGRNLLDDQNRERLKTVLGTIDWGGQKVDVAALATPAAIARGQRVMATKCTGCHDLRTILMKPRSGDAWHDVVVRMAEKPSFGAPIEPGEIPEVTAYLVALTPDIQESVQRKMADERERAAMAAEVKAEMEPEAPPAPSPSPAPTVATMVPTPSPSPSPVAVAKPKPAMPPIGDASKFKGVFEEQCSQCHKLSQVDKHGGDDEKGWREIVQRMITENEADLSPQQVRQIVAYLAATKPKK